MKKKLLLGGSVVSFICSILLLIYFLYDFFNPHFMLNEIESIIFLCLSSLFFYLGNLALNKYQEKIKPLKMTLIYILFLYILLLMELTIFDFRRGFHLEFILTNKEALKSYMATSVRLTPLATTLNFIRLLLEARISVNIFMYNVLGNIVCLMPFAVILPLLFKKQNKPIVFILTIILISLGIELTQFITASGTLDIDDIILNSLGAFICYMFFKIPSIKKLVQNIFGIAKNKINKKDILTYGLIIIGLIILFVILVWGVNYFKSKEFKGYEIDFVDEAKTCKEGLEKFYEDSKYIYYFDCYKSDAVYIMFNGNDKFLLKDFLNDGLNYEYKLNDIYTLLKNTNIGI